QPGAMSGLMGYAARIKLSEGRTNMWKHRFLFWLVCVAHLSLFSTATADVCDGSSDHSLLKSYPANEAADVPIDTAFVVDVSQQTYCSPEFEFSITVTDQGTDRTIAGDWTFKEVVTRHRVPIAYSTEDDSFCFAGSFFPRPTHVGIWKPTAELKPMTTYEMVITVANTDFNGDAADERTTVVFTTGTNRLDDAAPTLTELTLEHEVVEIAVPTDDEFYECKYDGFGPFDDHDTVILLPRSKATVKTAEFEPWWRYWLVISIEAGRDEARSWAGRLESNLETSRIFTTPSAWPDEACVRARATDLLNQTVVFESETCSVLPRQPVDPIRPIDEPTERTAGGATGTDGQNDNGCSCDSANQNDVFAWVGLLLVIYLRPRRPSGQADG
ncbi:MAG: hypothetical protein VX589_04335, partial [Myxococcota bacterium]|nr:hypothetical protein [Myxococcota bacterium]